MGYPKILSLALSFFWFILMTFQPPPLVYFILYAFTNDSNVFNSQTCWGILYKNVNEELKLTTEWFHANKLSLNLEKTNYIIFKSHIKKCSTEFPRICREGTLIIEVVSAKFLVRPMHTDQHISWKEHTKVISTKIAKLLVYYLVPLCLTNLISEEPFITLVYTYLAYCNTVLTQTTNRIFQDSLFFKNGQFVMWFESYYRAHTEGIFAKLYIFKLVQIEPMQNGEFVFKYERVAHYPLYLTTSFVPLLTSTSSHLAGRSNLRR